jgi:hypothetical protein
MLDGLGLGDRALAVAGRDGRALPQPRRHVRPDQPAGLGQELAVGLGRLGEHHGGRHLAGAGGVGPGDVDQLAAGVGQHPQHALDRPGHRGAGGLEPGPVDAQADLAERGGGHGRAAGQGLVGAGDPLDRAGQQADVVEPGREGQHAVDRVGAPGRLEPHDPAQRGGDAHRSAGVGAHRQVAAAVGHRHRRPRARSARDALGVDRVAGEADLVVDAGRAEGELVQRHRAQHHRARGPEPGHDGGVGGFGCGAGPGPGAGAEGQAGHSDQVLDPDQRALERPGGAPAGGGLVAPGLVPPDPRSALGQVAGQRAPAVDIGSEVDGGGLHRPTGCRAPGSPGDRDSCVCVWSSPCVGV